MERVNNTFQQLALFLLLRWYDLDIPFAQVKFAYNTTRTLGIEHTSFDANFGFSHEEPPYMLFNMRPSTLVLQDALVRLRFLYKMQALVHALVRTVLQLHKDAMQARLEPSTAPHFVRGDKVTIVTKNLLLRGQPKQNIRDRHLGPFTFEE
jgi:hypothetical protein